MILCVVNKISPKFDIPTCRDIVKNNFRINHIIITIETDEIWLPAILSELDFFPSNGQVKKNRPDCWREIDGDTFIDFPWCHLIIKFND